MRDNWQIRNKFILWYMGILMLASTVALVLMFFYARSKNIIVTEAVADTSVVTETEETTEQFSYKWFMQLQNSEGDEIVITCPDEVTQEKIAVSCRYDLKQVQLYVSDITAVKFKDLQPKGDFSYVSDGYCLAEGTGVLFSFYNTEACEVDVAVENNCIYISFFPYLKDERPVVAIDAGHGGRSVGTRAGDLSEKNITLAIAKKIEAASSDKPYRVMLVRSADDYIATVDRLHICEAVEADAYVGLHLMQDIEAPDKFGMKSSYNSLYYGKNITNAEFAGIILKGACVAAKNKALGVVETAEEDVILEALGIPSTVLYAGYMTNSEELKLLGRDAYIEMIASGVLNALDEMYAAGKLVQAR